MTVQILQLLTALALLVAWSEWRVRRRRARAVRLAEASYDARIDVAVAAPKLDWRALAFGVGGTAAGFGAGLAIQEALRVFTLAGLALGLCAARRELGKVPRDPATGGGTVIESEATVPQLESTGPASELVMERPPVPAAERRPPAAT